MISNTIRSWSVSMVICSLFLMAGCAKETAKVKAEPEKPIPETPIEVVKPKVEEQKPIVEVEEVEIVKPRPSEANEPAKPIEPEKPKPKVVPEVTIVKAEPEKQVPVLVPSAVEGVELVQRFKPQESTTYKVVTEASRTVQWEGPPLDKSTFKGGTTGSKIEMTFTQQIQTVDDKGNAVAKITIKQLKYLATVKDSVTFDFDSTREKDINRTLGKLIGQSYTIEISPCGEVLRVIDVNNAKAVVKGSTADSKIALTLLNPDTIKQLHTISALSGTDKKEQLQPGDKWRSLKTLSFGMMGSKAYERIYTLKDIIDEDAGRKAVVEMSAVPSAEGAQQLHEEETMGLFAKMFDSKDTYKGQLKLELTTGKVEKYFEKLKSEWVAVDPSAEQKGDKAPAALKMIANNFYQIEKID